MALIGLTLLQKFQLRNRVLINGNNLDGKERHKHQHYLSTSTLTVVVDIINNFFILKVHRKSMNIISCVLVQINYIFLCVNVFFFRLPFINKVK